jgi:hypothetical protein
MKNVYHKLKNIVALIAFHAFNLLRNTALTITPGLRGVNGASYVDMVGEGEFGNAPNINEAMRYTVQRPWEAEGIRQRLYDYLIYPTAGSTQFRFFQNPLGQGQSTSPGSVAGTTKTLADTNMTQPGTLPSPQMFLCTSIEFVFIPGSVATTNVFTPQVVYSFVATPTGAVPLAAGALNDLNAILPYGWLNFTIMSKSYLTEAALLSFPPKVQMQIDSSLAADSATEGIIAIASGKAGGRPYYMNPPVLLMPTANFEITVNFPVVIATPSGFNARIGVILDGFLYRNAQ